MKKLLSLLLSAVLALSAGSFMASAQTDVVPEIKTSNIIPGDVNGDGETNNKDLTRLFHYLSEWEVEVDTDVIDVNGDGEVDNKDFTRLFQYLSGWDVEISFRSISETTGFAWPVPGYYGISSPFGPRWGRNHNGIDISGGGINGKPIVAIENGVVSMANDSWTAEQGKAGTASYGNYCVVDHGNVTIKGSSAQYTSLYAHAEVIVVSVGQSVSKGQVLGYVGSTGNSTGPHLHLGIQKNGTWVNPIPLLSK